MKKFLLLVAALSLLAASAADAQSSRRRRNQEREAQAVQTSAQTEAAGTSPTVTAPTDSIRITAQPTTDTAAKKERRGLFRRLRDRLRRDQAENAPAAGTDTTVQAAPVAAEPAAPTPDDERRAAVSQKLDQLVQQHDTRLLEHYDQSFENALSQGDTLSALAYLELYQSTRDSLLHAQLEAQSAHQEAERQELVSYGAMGAVVMFLALSVVMFSLFRQKRRSNRLLHSKNDELNSKNAALNHANEEIRAQQEVLERQHQDIVDSITYARRIQEAVLPPLPQLKAALPESFVLYKPKDIVSGDFYWFHHYPQQTFLTAADCTGHGVPGAFMSMLGMSLLNEIVSDNPNIAPGEVLNRLHAGVIRALKQQSGPKVSQDGMDISLVALSPDRRMLKFAGANNPLYLLRNGELTQIDADKAPIGGGYFAEHRFTTHTVELAPGDRFFLFSDGIADQFGGPNRRKFTYRRLRELLAQTQYLPMPEVGDRIEKAFELWRGNEEQLDDVMVLGGSV